MLRKKILLGHLRSTGDCLYATAIARQIKNDYPFCYLTWAIGKQYVQLLSNNPFVDEIWEVDCPSTSGDPNCAWNVFEREARLKLEAGIYDIIFFTQIFPANYRNYDGTIRSSTFSNYPHKIEGLVHPVINLTRQERDNVDRYITLINPDNSAKIILFECSPQSGQSSINFDYALNFAKSIIRSFNKVKVILSSNKPFDSDDENIIDASIFSFRENLQIFRNCDLLIGCSSGISWLCTAETERKIPVIQVIDSDSMWFASMQYDFDYFNITSDHLIEMDNAACDELCNCVELILKGEFTRAKTRYHKKIKPRFKKALFFIFDMCLKNHDYKGLLTVIYSHLKRHSYDLKIAVVCFSYLVNKINRRLSALLK